MKLYDFDILLFFILIKSLISLTNEEIDFYLNL